MSRGRTARFLNIQPFGIEKAAAAAGHDPDVLRMENLDTDIAPPPSAVAVTREAVGRRDANSWLPFTGLGKLREAVADQLSEQTGRAYNPATEVVITGGALSGLLSTLLATVDHGDEVIVTDPTYAGFINRIRLVGAAPVFVPLTVVGSHWRLDLDRLASAVTKKTRALLLMSPSMPSGHVFTDAEWDAVAEACSAADCWLLYDAAMDRILFNGLRSRHPASLEALAERTITLGGVSKNYRMIGWRVGWAVGPAEVMRDVALAATYNTTVASGFGQLGAAAALLASRDGGDDGVAAAVAEWQARRDLVLRELDGLPVVEPDGGWSLLVNAVALGLKAPELAQRLLQHGRIAATPMTEWGQHVAREYVRLVFATEPVERLTGIRERFRAALR
ncbi:pyridoxal phosphate-dependent aminotransferase [Arthrobacter sp. P2b]|jgi:aspartate/methionine/tyrosine aminotransferase|uniref:pyridoxal phosphate-dependent aminotransferase n=1 Tax=Arthrobacter sp. P2b TaxID=1938741 RepID=UPI0009A66B8F|nr:pyridoxal phosphate-dependent aminotransferase [Arthrobacter sp. P2b]SLK12227.1 Aspartate/methionine/tyrosine aminotransferase [Arthrobacter sp. P2b]